MCGGGGQAAAVSPPIMQYELKRVWVSSGNTEMRGKEFRLIMLKLVECKRGWVSFPQLEGAAYNEVNNKSLCRSLQKFAPLSSIGLTSVKVCPELHCSLHAMGVSPIEHSIYFFVDLHMLVVVGYWL